MFARELAARLPSAPIIVTSVNPGLCRTSLSREFRPSLLTLLSYMAWRMFLYVVGRTAEAGSRQLVWAAIGAPHRERGFHGRYLSDMQIKEESDFAVSAEGYDMQTRIWACGLTLQNLQGLSNAHL
jgi:retinol dehydrogenase-12